MLHPEQLKKFTWIWVWKSLASELNPLSLAKFLTQWNMKYFRCVRILSLLPLNTQKQHQAVEAREGHDAKVTWHSQTISELSFSIYSPNTTSVICDLVYNVHILHLCPVNWISFLLLSSSSCKNCSKMLNVVYTA